jgi:hypothetical protein
MKKPLEYQEYGSFLHSLPIRSRFGTILVNSSEYDAPVVQALVAKRKLEGIEDAGLYNKKSK